MSKKDYESAATIAQAFKCQTVVEAFVRLFYADGNPAFDAERFCRACVPGANVKARPRKV